MTNPTSTSQKRKQANHKIREMAAKGEWPPVGHPWRALATLPRQEQEHLFHSLGWEALLVGLARLRDTAIATVSNTSKPQPLRDEACGIIGVVDILTKLEDEMAAFQRLVAEGEEK
jgi:hypothetical protein